MSLLTAALLTAALHHPAPYHAGESHADRSARMATIAEALAVESRPVGAWSRDAVAWLAWATWYEESGRFRHDVHSGQRMGDDGRSRCLGQIMIGTLTATRSEWTDLAGTDLAATRRCAAKTVEIIRLHALRCRVARHEPTAYALAVAAAGYGSGYSCDARHRHGGRLWAQSRGWRAWRLRVVYSRPRITWPGCDLLPWRNRPAAISRRVWFRGVSVGR